MMVFGIQFAPLEILWERSVQIISIIYFYTTFMLPITVSILTWTCIFYFGFKPICLLSLLYIAWVIYDSKTPERGGRRWGWYRHLKIWNYFCDYFPIQIIKTCELPPSKNYIMVYHPHGFLASGVFACFFTDGANFEEKFPGLISRVLSNYHFFYIPGCREQFLWAGVCSVSKESIEWLLTKSGKGNALVLTVGGAAESLEAHPGSATLVLKNRKGFVRLALKHGASLVPVFAFGQNDVFKQVRNPVGSYLRSFQNKFQKTFNFATPLVYGRGLFQNRFGFLPFRKPITVVIGKPIHLEADSKVTEEKVDATHHLYIDTLSELFEEYKSKYGPDLQLEFI